MKRLVVSFSLLASCLPSLPALAYDAFGTPDEDPQVRSMREEFKVSTSVTESDLHLGSTWDCFFAVALRHHDFMKAFQVRFSPDARPGYYGYDAGNYSRWFKPEWVHLDLDPSGIQVLKTQGVRLYDGTITKVYFRKKQPGRLIGEVLNDQEGSNAAPAVSVRGASAIEYYVCKARADI